MVKPIPKPIPKPENGWPLLYFDEDFGNAVEAARKARDMTQADLAIMLGCAQGMVSQVENHTVTRSRLVEPLCSLFGLDPPPQPSPNELEGRWNDVGRALRLLDQATFESVLEGAEVTLRAKKKPKRTRNG